MKKIIWISSFPKSGNTWVRIFLSNYFYNKSKSYDPKYLGYIPKFPLKKDLELVSNKLKTVANINNISSFWIECQKVIAKAHGDVVFLKNHNALLKINGKDFTNESFSLASIYIVRDPRDVIVSYANWLNLSIDQIIQKIVMSDLDNLFYLKSTKNPNDLEVYSSWKIHYLSWKNGMNTIPKIIIKYEDLINDAEKTLEKLLVFLKEIMNFNIDSELFKLSIENSDFKKLQDHEKKFGFRENSERKTNFFRSGKTKQWIKILNQNQINIIEKTFHDEMKELGYI